MIGKISSFILSIIILSSADYVTIDRENINCTMGMNQTFYWCTLYVKNVSVYGEIHQPIAVNASAVRTVWVECETPMFILTSTICDSFPNLQDLWIQNCQIETVEEDAFVNCKYLFGLSLQDNNIKQLERKLFRHNQQLGHLYLSNNFLLDLPKTIFKDLKKLERLNLDNNELLALDPVIFKGLESLRILEVHSNPLVDFQIVEIFEFCPNLREVSLGDTAIECGRLGEIIDTIQSYNSLQESLNHKHLKLAPLVDSNDIDCLMPEQVESISKYSIFFNSTDTGNVTLSSLDIFLEAVVVNVNKIWVIFAIVFGIVFLVTYFCYLIKKC